MKQIHFIEAMKNKLDGHSRTNVGRRMVAILLGVALCTAGAAGAWAWFDSTVSTAHQTLTVSTYSLTTTLQQVQGGQTSELGENAGENGTEKSAPAVLNVEPTDGKYTLTANNVYTLNITALGTAQTGYAQITVKGDTLDVTGITPTIKEGETAYTVTLVPTEACTLEVTPLWGTPVEATSLTTGQPYKITNTGFEAMPQDEVDKLLNSAVEKTQDTTTTEETPVIEGNGSIGETTETTNDSTGATGETSGDVQNEGTNESTQGSATQPNGTEVVDGSETAGTTEKEDTEGTAGESEDKTEAQEGSDDVTGTTETGQPVEGKAEGQNPASVAGESSATPAVNSLEEETPQAPAGM